jgi:hypothetical protein
MARRGQHLGHVVLAALKGRANLVHGTNQTLAQHVNSRVAIMQRCLH